MPVATTENAAWAGAVTVTLAGGVVILGPTAPAFTVNVAAVLVTVLTLLVTSTVNCAPLSPAAVGFSTYVVFVAPGMAVPFRRH